MHSMYYHFAILLLFRPLIKLRIIGSSISPRDVCSQAADAITGLLRSYAQLYTLRRTPSFVPYFVLTSSIMHLAIAAANTKPQTTSKSDDTTASPTKTQPNQTSQITTTTTSTTTQHPPAKPAPHVVEALSRGIADLTEMAPCHHFAEQALNILKFLAQKWNIDVEIKTTGETATKPPRHQTGEEGQDGDGGGERPGERDADTHKATRPLTSSLNFFAPNFLESDFSSSWGGGGSGRGGGGGSPSAMGADMRAAGRPSDTAELADALENPLFWPFPMQGRPMLPVGDELEEAGFQLL